MSQGPENCLTGSNIRRVYRAERLRIDSGDGLLVQSPAMTRRSSKISSAGATPPGRARTPIKNVTSSIKANNNVSLRRSLRHSSHASPDVQRPLQKTPQVERNVQQNPRVEQLKTNQRKRAASSDIEIVSPSPERSARKIVLPRASLSRESNRNTIEKQMPQSVKDSVRQSPRLNASKNECVNVESGVTPAKENKKPTSKTAGTFTVSPKVKSVRKIVAENKTPQVCQNNVSILKIVPIENSLLETVPSSQDFMGAAVDPLESRIKETDSNAAGNQLTPKRNREEGSEEVISHGKPPKILKTSHSASKKPQKEADGKAAKRKSSKRRSSFVRGRISQVFGALDGAGPSPLETPAPGEDPEVRLCKEALQQTLLSVRAEEPNVTRWHEFEVEVAHEVCESLERLRVAGFVLEDETDSQESTSSELEAIDESIVKCKASTEKLKTESLEWDRLLEEFKQSALEAEKQSREIEKSPITGPVGPLSPEVEAHLKSLPNYATFADEIRHTRETVILGVDKYHQITTAIQHFKSAATAFIQQQAQRLREKTFGAMEDYDDPKTIIEKFLAIESDTADEKL